MRPTELELITALAERGLDPRDLTIGKPIRWHLDRGSSIEWCVVAVDWARKEQAG